MLPTGNCMGLNVNWCQHSNWVSGIPSFSNTLYCTLMDFHTGCLHCLITLDHQTWILPYNSMPYTQKPSCNYILRCDDSWCLKSTKEDQNYSTVFLHWITHFEILYLVSGEQKVGGVWGDLTTQGKGRGIRRWGKFYLHVALKKIFLWTLFKWISLSLKRKGVDVFDLSFNAN